MRRLLKRSLRVASLLSLITIFFGVGLLTRVSNLFGTENTKKDGGLSLKNIEDLSLFSPNTAFAEAPAGSDATGDGSCSGSCSDSSGDSGDC